MVSSATHRQRLLSRNLRRICVGRFWEYHDYGGKEGMDMVASMAMVVCSAIEEAVPPVTRLDIPAVQMDRLRVEETFGGG